METVEFKANGPDEFIVKAGVAEFTVDRNELHNIVTRINEVLRHSLVIVPRLR